MLTRRTVSLGFPPANLINFPRSAEKKRMKPLACIFNREILGRYHKWGHALGVWEISAEIILFFFLSDCLSWSKPELQLSSDKVKVHFIWKLDVSS